VLPEFDEGINLFGAFGTFLNVPKALLLK